MLCHCVPIPSMDCVDDDVFPPKGRLDSLVAICCWLPNARREYECPDVVSLCPNTVHGLCCRDHVD